MYSSTFTLTCRRRKSTQWVGTATIAALLCGSPLPLVVVPAHAQIQPVGAGFVLDAGDLRFIFRQIKIAQAHAAGGALLGSGPNQLSDPRLPFGLRTVDGSLNHLGSGQTRFGAADRTFPRLTTKLFTAAEATPGGGPASTYAQKSGIVWDSQPRIISNLIVDQTTANPVAAEIAESTPGGGPTAPGSSSLYIPNQAADAALSAPFNQMFTFFGQFFDHGLNLVNKGGSGNVIVPLRDDDPLVAGRNGVFGDEDDLEESRRFMMLVRATNLPGSDGVVGTADDVQEATNQATPFVDQNQTYTSHPSHQVFLRQYALADDPSTPDVLDPKPVSTGRMLDGALPGNIGNWGEVKVQAQAMLGIALVDADIFDVPMLVTDLYGRFKRGPNGFPMMVNASTSEQVEGNPAAPVPTTGMIKTGHAFLDDIAHRAVPTTFDDDGNPETPAVAKTADPDDTLTLAPAPQPNGTYDNELLDRHFITGDGRGNENIALTAVHSVFHGEHNRLRDDIDALIPTFFTGSELAAWYAVDPGSGWDYGERLFQAAKFVTEMEYQHLVFEEFARKLVPSINVFLGDGINFQSDTNPALPAEFAHAVYRLGHSMLTEVVRRKHNDGSSNDLSLIEAFLVPHRFNECNAAGTSCRYPTAAAATGAIFQGNAEEIGNEIDEFVTEALRNNLLGLPLDLATINLARGRSEGLRSLNQVRKQLHLATTNSALAPYTDWDDFRANMRHPESLVNFIAAYGVHSTLEGNLTLAEKRAAAVMLAADTDFLFQPAATSGLDRVDLWIGGLAERIAPFGSMLGSTFSHVFEIALENLQNADRFYYLERLDGLNLLAQMEGNSFSEIVMRNSTAEGLPAEVFSRPALTFNISNLGFDPSTGKVNVDDPTTTDIDERTIQQLVRLPSGAIRYSGAEHVVWNGSDSAVDHLISSEGDDTLRGNGGNDRLEGGSGNDMHLGGLGDDVLLDLFGEDNMKGGPGNDAISGGAGPFDLLQGNEGHDFIVAGNDLSELFGGSGNDVMFTGEAGTEGFGGFGDDWIEGGPQLDLLVGDENNQFQDDPVGGHDVIIGGKGDDDYDSEGGDDIMVADVLGTERLEGMLGFDWVTYRGDMLPVDADMNIVGLLPPNVDELRDRFDLVEALSGWIFDDKLRGNDTGAADLGGPLEHQLTAQGIARVTGLQALFNATLGAGVTSFNAGNILLGGGGSDLLEGRGGDDVIDGDAWLQVQLRAPNTATTDPGDFKLVDTLKDLTADVFTAVAARRINPGQITIVRSIVVDTDVAPDCGALAPFNCDTALFSDVRANYTITQSSTDPTVYTISHVGGSAIDGTDVVRNVERAQFSDVTVTLDGDINNPATGTVTISDATPTENQVLTATQAITDADGFNAAAVTLTWQMGTGGVFSPIATGASFTPTDAHVGHPLRVVASFTDNEGVPETVTGATTAAVANVNDVPAGAPALSANAAVAQEGEVLAVSPATITDGDGLVGVPFTVQWQQRLASGGAFTNIAGATGLTFTLTQAQVNRRLRAQVSFTDNHGTAETVPSATSGVIGDVWVGTAAADPFGGTAGRDTASGLGGDDTINTVGGNDVVDGGAGNDTINTGAGNDIIQFTGSAGGFDAVTGGAGTDEIRATAANTVIGLSSIATVERIVSGGFAGVQIHGSATANVFNFSGVTLTGITKIDGRGGSDTITGTGLVDVIDGGAGDDTLNAGAGNDSVTGGNGNDTMNGAGGADTFLFAAGFGADLINGFDSNPTGGQDRLDVSGLGITSENFGASVVITAVGTDTLITIGANTIRLVGVARATVTEADFILAATGGPTP